MRGHRVGKTYVPTDHVDIFFSTDEIKRPYETMGKIRAEIGDMLMTFGQMERNLVKEAMARGADGIVIEEMKTVSVGSTGGTFGHDTGSPKYFLGQDGTHCTAMAAMRTGAVSPILPRCATKSSPPR